MIRGIHHVSVATFDLDRLSAFYVDLLGFKRVTQGEWKIGSPRHDAIVGLKDSAARYVMLAAENCYLEIFEYSSPKGKATEGDRPVCDPGYTHFCLDVSDIDSEYERLVSAGVRFHAPPSNGISTRATYSRDPDGNIVELMEILDPDHPYRLQL